MAAPELTAAEREKLAEIEAAPAAEEAIRERVARAVYVALAVHREIGEGRWNQLHDWQRVVYYRQADAALAVLRPAVVGDRTEGQ